MGNEEYENKKIKKKIKDYIPLGAVFYMVGQALPMSLDLGGWAILHWVIVILLGLFGIANLGSLKEKLKTFSYFAISVILFIAGFYPEHVSIKQDKELEGRICVLEKRTWDGENCL